MRHMKVLTGGKSNEAAFERFIASRFDTLYRRAYQLTGDVDEAEDLVQELCIRAHASFDELEHMDNSSAWLLRVLFHLFVDSVRRNKRSPVHVLSVLGDDDFVAECESSEPGPAEQADTALHGQRLERALRILGPVDQALLILREVEGYSLSEIGAITELPASTLKSRLQRARIKLGRLLERAEYGITQNAGEEGYELQRRREPAG